jgi:plasmid stability protein
MKTTLDLPEELVREMKLRAVREGRKLRDVATEVFRRGLAANGPTGKPARRRRVKLPIIPAPPGAAKMKLTGDDVHRLEMETESESYEASVRR